MDGREFSFGGSSGKIFQLGFVVRDLSVAMRFFSETLDIGPFTVMEGFVAPSGCYRGSTENPTLSMAHAFAGRIFLELIEQRTDTPSVYTEHVEQYGYGLHHFGLSVAPEDYDGLLADFLARGFEEVFSDRLPTGARIRYLAPKDPAQKAAMAAACGAGFYECVEIVPGEEAFFAEMRGAAENRGRQLRGAGIQNRIGE